MAGKGSVEVKWQEGGNSICKSMEVGTGWAAAAGMVVAACEWMEWLVADGGRWLRGGNTGFFVCV